MVKRISIIIFLVIIISIVATPTGIAQTNYPMCSQTQHSAYTMKDPEGNMRSRWHPQIDQLQHCAFGHEHGSDPGMVLPSNSYPHHQSPADLPMGYAAAKANVLEAHEGFKLFAFDDRNGHLWRIGLHQGSSALGRICARFHEVAILIVDNHTWETLADVRFMGDFGKATSNLGQSLTPTACPNQAQDATADGSSGVRQFRVHSQSTSPVYDPWRIDDRKLIIPIDIHAMTFWPQTSINDPADLTADTLLPNTTPDDKPYDGIERFFQYYPGTGIESTAIYSGTFYTDPYGRSLRNAIDIDAVKQYIKPGSSFSLPQPMGKCFPWGIAMIYHCGGTPQGWQYDNYSGAIQSPN